MNVRYDLMSEHPGSMMGSYPAFHRARQPVPFAAQAAFGQVGEGLGVSMTGGKLRQDQPSRDSRYIRSPHRQLDVGIFRELLYPIDQSHPLLDKRAAIAGQVPQFPLGHRRHKASAQQAMLQEVGQPGGIFDIGLPPRDSLHMLGIDQLDLEHALQHVEDRFPVVARTLH